MIVKNAAAFLPQCLESVREVVQEMVIADTGSTDATPQIAESFGARLIRIPWQNDFAAARNLCLNEVRSSWVLSLDADEVLQPNAAPFIVPLLQGPSVGGYQVTIRNFVLSLQDRIWDRPALPNDSGLPVASKYPAYVDHQNVRIFRNEPGIRFGGRVHESVGPSLLRNNRTIGSATFLIYHFGLAVAAEERAAKNRFYRELGRQKLRDMPNDAQAHLELGIVELDNFANLDEALRLFSEACRLNPGFAIAWFFQGLGHLRKERFSEALRCLRKSESLGHHTPLVAETIGDAFYNSGKFCDAARSYEIALHREPGNPWMTSKLGLALVRSGSRAAGLSHLRAAINRLPEAGELHDRLMFANLAESNLAAAAEAMMSKLVCVPQPAAADFLRTASLCSKAEQFGRASQIIDLGLESFPENENLLMARSEISNLLASKQLNLVTISS
jgi:glycosyltransferase involved in cell wall biosynthesis